MDLLKLQKSLDVLLIHVEMYIIFFGVNNDYFTMLRWMCIEKSALDSFIVSYTLPIPV